MKANCFNFIRKAENRDRDLPPAGSQAPCIGPGGMEAQEPGLGPCPGTDTWASQEQLELPSTLKTRLPKRPAVCWPVCGVGAFGVGALHQGTFPVPAVCCHAHTGTHSRRCSSAGHAPPPGRPRLNFQLVPGALCSQCCGVGTRGEGQRRRVLCFVPFLPSSLSPGSSNGKTWGSGRSAAHAVAWDPGSHRMVRGPGIPSCSLTGVGLLGAEPVAPGKFHSQTCQPLSMGALAGGTGPHASLCLSFGLFSSCAPENSTGEIVCLALSC